MAGKNKKESKLKLGKNELNSVSGGVNRGEVLGWLRQHNPIAVDYNDFLDLALSMSTDKLPSNADEWGTAYDEWIAAGRPGKIHSNSVQPIEPQLH